VPNINPIGPPFAKILLILFISNFIYIKRIRKRILFIF